jgi:L-2-amino-thiazoline-4-carboxylic acid hydrolase
MKNDDATKNDRREFIIKTFSSCALCFFTASCLFGSDKKLRPIALEQQHKFQSDSGMSIQEVYNFAYKEWYIPAMKNLMKQIGREKFLEMLKKSSEMLYENDKNAAVDYKERTLTVWSKESKELMKNWSNRLTGEILTDNENVLEIRYTECLWAKTFREADAADIGYAVVCYQDYPDAKAYNPKLTLIREKTLMQGHDCCHFKWVMET